MPADPRRANAWSGIGIGWGISATMMGGVLAWGGIGYLLDRWLGTAHVFAVVGIFVGAAGATYLVYLRYGKGDDDARGA